MKKTLSYLISFIFSSGALAECPSPTKWIESFYATNYDFYTAAPVKLKNSVTPEFLKLLQKEAKYSSNHTEVGALDYDPWLGAQDGKIGRPVNFKTESQSPDKAIVAMSYPFLVERGQTIPAHIVRFVLHSSSQNCWLLHDFITPVGDSLSDVLSSINP